MKEYSLKTKMGLAVSGLIAVFLLAMALYAFAYFETAYKKTIAQQEFLLAENIAREVDDKLDNLHIALIAASKAATADMVADSEKAQAFLDAKPGLTAMFDNHIFFFSLSGNIIAEAPFSEAARRGQNFSHREYIQTTLKTGKPHIGAPYVSSQSHKHPAVMLTAPIYDEDGRMIAIMAGGVDLMRANFLGALPSTKIGDAGYFYLYNTDRLIIIHPEPNRILKADVPLGANRLFDEAIQGFEGVGEVVDSRGVPMLAAFKRLNKTNWILVSNHPTAEVYAPFIQAKQAFAVGAPLGVFLLVAAVWWVVRQMTLPLVQLTSHVESLSSKQGSERFSTIIPNDEIGELSIAFNKMLRELDQQTALLEQSEDLYRTVTEFSSDMVFWRCPQGNIIYVSPNCQRITGYEDDKFYNDSQLLDAIVFADDREKWQIHVERTPNSASDTLEFRINTSFGIRWISCVSRHVFRDNGELCGLRGSHLDITERKASEELLKNTEEKTRRQNKHLASLNKITLGLINRYDISELFEVIVEQAGELVGTKHGFIHVFNADAGVFERKVGLGIYKQDVGRMIKLGEGLVSRAYQSGRPELVEDYSVWESGLQDPMFKEIGSVLQIPLKSEGQVIGTMGLAFTAKEQRFGEDKVEILSRFAELASIALDNARLYTAAQQELLERKRVEEALRLANDNLEDKVLQRTKELITLNGELIGMNEEHIAMNEELQTINAELQREITERLRVEKALADVNEEHIAMNEELTAMNEELQSTNKELHNEVVERQRVEQELTKAIADLKTMQAHLIQSEKMAALGSLVAGVAHEINTPVGVGITAASHLMQETEQFLQLCKQGAPLRQDLVEFLANLQEISTIIFRNMERAGKLIQSFKQVSTDQSSENQRVFNVKKYLDEVLLSMNPEIRKTKHRISVQGDDEITINGLPGAFAQVITNLVMNSLTHAYGPEDEGNIRIMVRKEDAQLVLSYTDDGAGMDREVLDKIFDPFFTTKRGTGGTGLGLSVVYNIVTQQFGGKIECNSAPGKGATFNIYLPL